MSLLRSLLIFALWQLGTKRALATDYTFGTGDHFCGTSDNDCADSKIDIQNGSDFSLQCKSPNSCDSSTIVVHSNCTLRDPGIDCDNNNEACINAKIMVYSSDLTTNEGVYLDCKSGERRLCKDMQLILVDSHLKLKCGNFDCGYLEARLFGSSTLELVVDSVFSDVVFYLFNHSNLIDNDITDGYEIVDRRPTDPPFITTTTTTLILTTETTAKTTTMTPSNTKRTNLSFATSTFWDTTTLDNDSDGKSKSALPFPVMYGAIGAGIVVLVIFGSCCFCLYQRRASKQIEEETSFDRSTKRYLDRVDTNTPVPKNTVEEKSEAVAFIDNEEMRMKYATPGIGSDIDLRESSSE